MTQWLLDTNHAATLLRDEHSPLWNRIAPLTSGDCLLCRPVVAELWYMVFNSQRVQENRRKLEALLAQFTIHEFDERAAVEFGRIRAELRRHETPIPAFDVMIAAISIVNGVTLVTADRHFSAVQGLSVANWI